jgi:hypothetical protein
MGTFSFTVQVSDSTGTANLLAASIVVQQGTAAAVTTIFLIHGILQGDPYSANGHATSSPPLGEQRLETLESTLQQYLNAAQFVIDGGFDWDRPTFRGK